MSGRILVVDDLEPNRRLLQARLEAEYYEVILANDGVEALEMARATRPDLVLLDVMMPRLDGFETCKRLKAHRATAHVPVVMVTALDQQDDRVRGLEAGADDFLTKPLDDLALFARVKSLLRLKFVTDELRARDASGPAMTALEEAEKDESAWEGAKILIIGDPGRGVDRLARRLGETHKPHVESDPRAAVKTAAGAWDLAIIDLTAESFDGMRLVARLRSDDATRHLPVLAVVDPGDRDRFVRALDIGANDVLFAPVDAGELAARARTQIKRKRYADFLRNTLDQSFEMALTDQLTGLHNRRAMDTRFQELADEAVAANQPMAVLIADIDHFKRINDTYGHGAGDLVLKEFAARLGENVRAVDVACRYGGEEFVVLMPGADLEAAKVAADRFRASVEAVPFTPEDGDRIAVTTSVGVAGLEPGDTAERMLKRADQALYAAKQRGRNRVVVARLRRAAA